MRTAVGSVIYPGRRRATSAQSWSGTAARVPKQACPSPANAAMFSSLTPHRLGSTMALLYGRALAHQERQIMKKTTAVLFLALLIGAGAAVTIAQEESDLPEGVI